MHAEACNLMTQDGGFFDITHSFRVGPSTYHILGLRKDQPTYRNTYYIFNCTNDQHELTNDFLPRSTLFNRYTRTSEQTTWSKHRSLTAHRTRTTPVDDLTNNKISKQHSLPSRPRARTEEPKKVEIDTTVIRETLTKAMITERRTLVASLRKEMAIKKKALIRSMKKENEVLLQATKEANKKEEIIRLLEEQNNSLANAYEKCVSTTASSIDALKQTLLETLDAQHNTSQSAEHLQLTLIQTIEQEVQNIVLKNEEILRSTSIETNAINQLQTTLIQKIEKDSTTKKHDDATLQHLFAEQKQVLTDAVLQQQNHALSLDMIKQTMIDALNFQQSTSVNITTTTEHPHQPASDNINNLPSQQIQTNNYPIVNNNSHRLPRMKSSQHLVKISIKSPEPAHIFAKLIVDGMEYSRRLYTLCQRDPIQKDVFNCYIAPPTKDSPCEVTIYAKTKKETAYRAAICIRLPGSNISQPITFPLVHQSFEEHQCILIEPLQRLVRKNEQVLIHMIVPDAYVVKIRNGDDTIVLDEDEYRNGIVKKKVRVRGDLYVCGCWDKKTDSTMCVFNMNRNYY
jgi:hypothetical protein